MSSYLSSIMANAATTSPTPPPQTQQNTPARSDHNDDAISDFEGSHGSDEDEEALAIQMQASIQDPAEAISAFTINTARNLRLTADGENSLLQFSQVLPSFFHFPFTMLT